MYSSSALASESALAKVTYSNVTTESNMVKLEVRYSSLAFELIMVNVIRIHPKILIRRYPT